MLRIAAVITNNGGAFRDMFQNHMMQLMALVAMEPPVALEQMRFETKRKLRARFAISQLMKLTSMPFEANILKAQSEEKK